ncbi:MAG: FkbM family methyltransferase [Gammaproteobacteria bacterium]
MGRNAESAALARAGLVSGLLDDRASPGDHWQGLPVRAMSGLPAGSRVANCSTSIAPVDVERRLASLGVDPVPYAELAATAAGLPGPLPLPDFVREQREDFDRHRGEWEALFASMADEPSRQCLADVLCYRLSADPAHMAGYGVRLRDQYFEPFLQLSGEVFVDAGGFDGDTTEEFCTRYPDYRCVHLFEPSARNMAAARRRLEGRANICFHELGVSDAASELVFDADAGSASAVGEGSERIRVVALDEYLPEAPTFIKMDLEGWELHALRGAARTIAGHRPKLAIAVYHRASDFREIPALLRSFCPDYRVFLRHYTQGWSETVMFFVPPA